jgi:rubredoxin
MKCLCGYEYKEEFDGNETVAIKGDAAFVEIDGHFTTRIEYDYNPSEIVTVSIYACPRCKTLKTDHN